MSDDPIVEDPDLEGEGTEPEEGEGTEPEEPEVTEPEEAVVEEETLPECDSALVGFAGPLGVALEVCVNTPQPKNIIDGVAYAHIELLEADRTPDVLEAEVEEEEESEED